jgi:hypothetical protein
MPGVQESIVNAVVAYVDAQVYSLAFTPYKKLIPTFDRDDLAGLDVAVFAAPTVRQKQTRAGTYLKTHTIGLVLRYPADVSAAELETRAGQFLQLCEEISGSLESVNMAGFVPDEIEQDVPYDIGKINDLGLFMAQIFIKYKGF